MGINPPTITMLRASLFLALVLVGAQAIPTVFHTDDDACYGDISSCDTNGCSKETAQANNVPWDDINASGVEASWLMAAQDAQAMLQYKDMIEQTAEALCCDPSYIAGIISRETRAGATLGDDGYGADGHGYGLMQIDDSVHSIQGGPFSLDNIMQGTQILLDNINCVAANHPDWTADQALFGGIAAYDAGCANVVSFDSIDVGTTNNDYANDVTARSQWFEGNGY